MKSIVGCRVLALGVVLVFGVASPVEGQIFDRIKSKVKERVEQKTDEGMDRALDQTEEAITCLVTDPECVAAAEEEGKAVRVVDEEGNEVERAAVPSSQEPGARRSARPGEGAWANYDFVPGERVIFADDFAGEQVGNFPRRMEYLFGAMQVVEAQGKKWLAVESDAAFQIILPEALPERFTVEFDLTMPWPTMYFYPAAPDYEVDEGQPAPNWEASSVMIAGTAAGIYREANSGHSEKDPRDFWDSEEDPITGQVHRARLQVDGKYAKFYLDEQRMANVPVTEFVRSNRLVFHAGGYPVGSQGEDEVPTLFTDFSINAGGRAIYDALVADGRIVTRGILFDTGSDRLRPESTPTLNEIGGMLTAHPELRIRIEGHTDSDGDDQANLTLSQRRADAVKAFLVEKHGVEGDRVQTQGLGETVPAADNGTAEGRQNNRRVELVRL